MFNSRPGRRIVACRRLEARECGFFESLEDRLLLSVNIQRLGELPGGKSESGATAVSGDGSIVLGYSYDQFDINFDEEDYEEDPPEPIDAPPVPFYWSEQTDMLPLSTVIGIDHSSISNNTAHIADDGSIIIVNPIYPGSSSTVWEQGRGFLSTDEIVGEELAQAATTHGFRLAGDVSNERVFAGWIGDAKRTAFVARQGAATVFDLSLLPQPEPESCFAALRFFSSDGSTVLGNTCGTHFVWDVDEMTVSTVDGVRRWIGLTEDGSTAFGEYRTSNSSDGTYGVLTWTEAGGVDHLPAPNEAGLNARPSAISADGSVVVGTFEKDGANPQAFRWTSLEGYVPLGALNNSVYRASRGLDVSADGNVVVGVSYNGSYDEAVRWTLPPATEIELNQLSHATSSNGKVQPNLLELEYELGGRAKQSFTFELYREGSESPLLTFDVSSESTSAPNVTPKDSSDDLWGSGSHTLQISPQGALLSALSDPAAESLYVVVNETGLSENRVPFRGFYQASPNEPMVVRTGPGTKDNVAILNGGDIQYRARSPQSNALVSSALANANSASEIIVITGDQNDSVLVGRNSDNALQVGEISTPLTISAGAGDDIIDSGSGNDQLIGGSGSDTYYFANQASGTDVITETGSSSLDTLDFSAFKSDQAGFFNGITLDLNKNAAQPVAENLTLRLTSPTLIENVHGSARNDFIRGNARENKIVGNDGNDLLVGAGGADPLIDGGAGDNILVGDDYNLTDKQWEDFANAFDWVAKGCSADGACNGSTIPSLNLVPIGTANDMLQAGSGNSVFLGGGGNDTINATATTNAFIVGDSLTATPRFTVQDFWGSPDVLLDANGLASSLDQAGNDIIVGSSSGSNVVFGGAGMDTIQGSNQGWDILFGNNETDEIRGLNGSNIIVGGDNDSVENLTGGGDFDLIIGDGFSFTSEVAFSLTDLQNDAKLSAALQAGFDIDGQSQNRIETGAGTNLVFGSDGNDHITGGNADGSFDMLFGEGGSDFIDALGGHNLVVGGTGSDDGTAHNESSGLKASGSVNVVLGDELDFSTDFSFSGLTATIANEAATSLLQFGQSVFDVGKASEEGEDDTSTTPTEPQQPIASDDRIAIGAGTSLVLAGEGSDNVQGSDEGVDVIFAGDGNDSVDGMNGFNVIVGGEGDDRSLRGGDDVDIILGDSFAFEPGGLPAFDSLTLASPLSAVKDLALLFNGVTLSGSGWDVIHTGEGFNLALGGAGTDEIHGGSGGDVLFGNDHNDDVYGYRGVDLLVGGDGNDFLNAGANLPGGGNDVSANFVVGDSLSIDGGFDVEGILAGDILEFLFPNIKIEFPDSGNDVLVGANGFDFLVGGDGEDDIFGNDGDNLIFGDTFKRAGGLIGDTFSILLDLLNPLKSATLELVKTSIDKIIDFFTGSQGNTVQFGDRIFGGPDRDFIFGGDGDDELYGDSKLVPITSRLSAKEAQFVEPETGGFDFIVGGYGDDMVNAGPSGNEEKVELLWGLIQLGTIGWGGLGDDTFVGGSGNDLMGSTLGDDTFYGGPGRDVLIGGEDNDQLFGEEGDDLLYGEGGDDLMDGGEGFDQLYGGSGQNEFVDALPEEIIELNTAPTATSELINVIEDGEVQFTLGASDTETSEAELLFTIQSLPQVGRLVTSTGELVALGKTFTGAPTLTYRPGASHDGQAEVDFAFTVTDNGPGDPLTSDPAVVDLQITEAVEDGEVTIDPNGVLRIGGTADNDRILVTRSLVGSYVKVWINGQLASGENIPLGNLSDVRIWGREGDDNIRVVGLGKNTMIHGGDGNDRVRGGFGSDILFGGPGNDRLYGGFGHDLLIGGEGADRLSGSFGDDLLIGDSLDSALSIADLRSAIESWHEDDEIDESLANGLLDDGVVDHAFGGFGNDWKA